MLCVITEWLLCDYCVINALCKYSRLGTESTPQYTRSCSYSWLLGRRSGWGYISWHVVISSLLDVSSKQASLKTVRMKFVRLCLLFNVPRFLYLVDILVFDHQRIYECSGLIDVVLLYYLSISFLTQLVDIFRRLTVVNCSAEGFVLVWLATYSTSPYKF